MKTAEQLVKAGNVDGARVRETTKRLDTLWQGLTSRLNTHKEALSYSVTFHQKLEQVTSYYNTRGYIEGDMRPPLSFGDL